MAVQTVTLTQRHGWVEGSVATMSAGDDSEPISTLGFNELWFAVTNVTGSANPTITVWGSVDGVNYHTLGASSITAVYQPITGGGTIGFLASLPPFFRFRLTGTGNTADIQFSLTKQETRVTQR